MKWDNFDSSSEDIVIEDEDGNVKNYEIKDTQIKFTGRKSPSRRTVVDKFLDCSITAKPSNEQAFQKLAMKIDPIYEQYILKGYNVEEMQE